MSNISDINIEGMEKSVDAVTYIEKTLFSYIFDFDGSTELWLSVYLV